MHEIDILLVEDNPDHAELALRALAFNGLNERTLWVKDGVEAVEFLFGRGEYADRRYSKPKVILLDLKLPRMDGLDVLRQIRSRVTTKSIPVVVLTSSEEDRDIIESYWLGANSYIVKPVSFDNFSEAIKKVGLYWLALNRPPTES